MHFLKFTLYWSVVNNVLVSGVQQSDSVMPVLFLILFPFRLLQNIEPSSLCYIVDTCWLSIYLFKIQWYVPVNPRLPIYSRSHLFPWVTVSLLSKSMSLFLFCLSSFASLFLTYWLLHYGCLSLTSLSMIISRSIHVAANGIQFSSVAQSCLTLCDPMDCSIPGFPVHHQLPKPAQTHVHRVGDGLGNRPNIIFGNHHILTCALYF